MSVPMIGQVWQRGALKRRVVEVLCDRECGAIMQVGWQRPGNDWRTFYTKISSWMVWRGKATLVLMSDIQKPDFGIKAGQAKNCPACAAAARIVHVGSFWQVLCSKNSQTRISACQSGGEIRNSQEDAIRVWNELRTVHVITNQ